MHCSDINSQIELFRKQLMKQIEREVVIEQQNVALRANVESLEKEIAKLNQEQTITKELVHSLEEDIQQKTSTIQVLQSRLAETIEAGNRNLENELNLQKASYEVPTNFIDVNYRFNVNINTISQINSLKSQVKTLERELSRYKMELAQYKLNH